MILLKNAHILDSASDHHDSKKDILIDQGIIKEIGDNLSADDAQVIDHENLHVSIGWIDSSVSFGAPGLEERQSIKNGLATASKSGFTSILLNPNNQPNPENAAGIRSLKSLYKNKLVDVHPLGSLTLNQDGEHLAELFDMHEAGCAGFYDFKKSISNANLLKIALQYTKSFSGLVHSYPVHNAIAGKGMVNEDHTTIHLGIKSQPALAESLQVARDIEIARYTDAHLHIPTISTIESLELIKNAKAQGLKITCSISAHYLVLDSSALEGFDTNYKLQPPLRSKETVSKIMEFILDGTIDMVTSDHIPLNIEHKDVEFDQATAGSIGLESVFGLSNEKIGLEKTIDLLTSAYSVYGIARSEIRENSKAVITLFDPEHSYKFEKSNIVSESKNAAAIGQKCRGKVLGTINGKASQFNF